MSAPGQLSTPDRSSTPSQYTIVGGGAIGGTIGFALATAGHSVRIIDQDAEHVGQINEHGLRLRRGGEDLSVAVEAFVPGDYSGPLGKVILAVKAQATVGAAAWIAPLLDADGYVVSLQNGFNEETIAEAVGPERVLPAFVNLFADVVAPGIVLDGGMGALVVGELDGSISPRVEALVRDLQAWGPAKATENVPGYLWSKAGFGAMLSATALADAPMAGLIDAHRPTMFALAAEVFEVSSRLGIELEPFDAFDPAPYASQERPLGAAAVAATDALVAWLATQAKDRSGIWRDIAVRHRPVEVTTHYAHVFAEADRLGVRTPVLRRMLDLLADIERDPHLMNESHLDTLDRLAADS